MPLFLLMGGELVIAFLLARIAIWMLRGRHALRETLHGPGGPGGGGGLRAPVPARARPPVRRGAAPRRHRSGLRRLRRRAA